jgi:hypothetical protein
MEGWKITIILTQNWQELLHKRLQRAALRGGGGMFTSLKEVSFIQKIEHTGRYEFKSLMGKFAQKTPTLIVSSEF